MPARIPSHKPPGADQAAKAYEHARPRQADKNFYATARWRQLRAYKLATDPLCEQCRKGGRVTAARHVHHTRPRKDRPDLAYNCGNLESLCVPCHNAMEKR